MKGTTNSPNQLINPLEGRDFLISLIPARAVGSYTYGVAINEKLNNNFSLTNSKISWSDYFISTTKGPFGEVYTIPDEQLGYIGASANTDSVSWGQGEGTFDQVLNHLDELKTMFVDNYKGGAMSWGGLPPRTEGHRRLILNMPRFDTGDHYPRLSVRSSLNSLFMFSDLGYIPGDWDQDWSMRYFSAMRLAYRLTTFQYVSLWGGNPGEPHIPNGYKAPQHTYFVGDFPIGVPSHFGSREEDKYVKTGRRDLLEFLPSYRYHSSLTEDFSRATVPTERQLPNIYTFYSFKTNVNNFSYYEEVLRGGMNQDVDKQDFQLDDYYKLATTYEAGDVAKRDAQLDRYKKVVFGSNLEILKDVKTIQKYFPYSIQIDLPNIHPSPAMKIVEERGTNKAGVWSSAVDHWTTLLANYTIDPWQIQPHSTDIHKFILFNMPSLGNTDPSLSDLQIFNLSDFFSGPEKTRRYVKYVDDYKCVKFGKINSVTQDQELSDDPDAIIPLYTSIFNSIWEDQTYYYGDDYEETSPGLQSYINKKALDFWDMYEGKKCHTEILVFEIAKFKINEFGEKELIQSIFIPNVSSFKDAFSYIDTQIFPNHLYTYEVFTHTLLIGNMYKFGRMQDSPMAIPRPPWEEGNPPGPPYAVSYFGINDAGLSPDDTTIPRPMNFLLPSLIPGYSNKGILNSPIALIIRTPYYNNESLGSQLQTIVTSKPPLPPDIAFYAYKDVADKVLILLNQSLGRRSMLPLPVFEDDPEKIQKQFAAQQYENKLPTHLLYESDDFRGRWEIYRTTQEPLDLKDFSSVIPTSIEAAEKSGYEDLILPNTDYYYIARFVDLHENISNPTGIFYLRMVEEEGFPPYLLARAHNITDFHRNIVTRRFKKFIKIKLKDSIRRVTGNSSESAQIGYDPGDSKQLNKYKFRITSLKTGKQIDINVGFNFRIKEAPMAAPNALAAGEAGEMSEAMAAKLEEALNINLDNENETSC